MKKMNIPLRIIKTDKGFLVQKKVWWFWKPSIFWRGTDEPYYFESYDSAMSSLIVELRWVLIIKQITT